MRPTSGRSSSLRWSLLEALAAPTGVWHSSGPNHPAVVTVSRNPPVSSEPGTKLATLLWKMDWNMCQQRKLALFWIRADEIWCYTLLSERNKATDPCLQVTPEALEELVFHSPSKKYRNLWTETDSSNNRGVRRLRTCYLWVALFLWRPRLQGLNSGLNRTSWINIQLLWIPMHNLSQEEVCNRNVVSFWVTMSTFWRNATKKQTHCIWH